MFRISLALLAALAVVPASAAARWSPPATLTAAVGQAADPAPQIAISASGAAVAVWSPGNTGVALRAADHSGRFGPARLVARHGHNPDVVVAGDGSALIAWADRGRVFVMKRSARGRLGTARPIGPRVRGTISGPSMAIASNGEAAIVWTSGPRAGFTWAAIRSPAGAVSAPQRLGTGFLDTFGADPIRVDALGDAAVAFLTPAASGNTLMVARRPAGAAAFDPAVAVGGAPVTQPALAAGAAGDLTVAWVQGLGFESDFDGPLEIAGSASAAPAARAFQPQAAPLGSGAAAAIGWTNRVRQTRPSLLNGPLSVLVRALGGTLGAPRPLDANPLARRLRLEPLSPFRALAVWTSTPSGSRRLVWRAAVAGADGRFARVRAPSGRAPSFTRAQGLATGGHYAALIWQDGARLRATVGHL